MAINPTWESEMDDRNLREELETVTARLAALEEERQAERTARIGPRLRRAARDPKLRFVLLCAAVVIPAAAYAAIIGVPSTFTNGTIADANEVNVNFNALVAESNDQHARLSALEASSATNASNIASNFSSISNNISNINSNTANLASDAVLITNNFNSIASNLTAISSNSSGVTANSNDIASNTSFIAANVSGLGALQTLLASVSVNGSTLTFSGVNVAIVSGSGTTDGATNSVGNLIIGYNENAYAATRTGSHNLVVGMDHEYTSHSGQTVGERNSITAPRASVSGGSGNQASGIDSSVSGGFFNTAAGYRSNVSGGSYNQASGSYATVNGGQANQATHGFSSVSGGAQNIAAGLEVAISGGSSNTASANSSVIAGGTGISTSGSGSAIELEMFTTSTSTGDTGPESYYLSSPPITCDSAARGRIFIGRPSANDQDSICYCGEFSGSYNVYCFNP